MNRMHPHYGLTVFPRVGVNNYTPSISSEEWVPMVELAQKRCEPIMRELAMGRPLTDVLVKAYLQGFIDYHQTIQAPSPKEGA